MDSIVTEQNDSLFDYLQTVEKLVAEYQIQDHIEDQHHNLEQIVNQARLLNDSLQIYNAWQKKMSVQLYKSYSDSEILDLHGTSLGESRLVTHGDYIEIHKPDEIIRFILCKHATYSPIFDGEILSHQCLVCE